MVLLFRSAFMHVVTLASRACTAAHAGSQALASFPLGRL